MTGARVFSLALGLLAAASSAAPQTLVAAQTIRARSLIAAGDLAQTAQVLPGALSDPAQAIGREARVTLYAGRPIRPGDIGPPALVERNQLVLLRYRHGGLSITAEGRALDRGGLGERVRAMNLASRSTLTGVVAAPGEIDISAAPGRGAP